MVLLQSELDMRNVTMLEQRKLPGLRCAQNIIEGTSDMKSSASRMCSLVVVAVLILMVLVVALVVVLVVVVVALVVLVIVVVAVVVPIVALVPVILIVVVLIVIARWSWWPLVVVVIVAVVEVSRRAWRVRFRCLALYMGITKWSWRQNETKHEETGLTTKR